MEYIVVEGAVKIVDEQTGVSWRAVDIPMVYTRPWKLGEREDRGGNANIRHRYPLQNYFRMYHKLAGMTGTAETEASELWSIYKLDVVTIPPTYR